MLNIGDLAKDFTLPTDSGDLLSLKALRGKKVILYFYPRDNTPGCTKEACAFRDGWHDLKKLQTTVIGISKDSVAQHQKFKQLYALPFTLLSDKDHTVCEDYGVMVEKLNYGKKYIGIERSTFLLDEKGVIQAIWRKVKVDNHFADILQQLEKA